MRYTKVSTSVLLRCPSASQTHAVCQARTRILSHTRTAHNLLSSPPSSSSSPFITHLSDLLLPSFTPLHPTSAQSVHKRTLATPAAMITPATSTTITATKSVVVPDITEEVGGLANVERLNRTARDFRSDTFTMPSDAQLLFALRASRGDDVYGEDSATAALEARIARMAGKEAALFGMSGTMTNQLAIRTHMKQPPHSVITDHRAHVHKMEAGGIAMFSQATTHALVPANGSYLTVQDIEPALQLGTNIHLAPTRLICLENTLSGIIFPQEEVVRIAELAHSHGINMHLDGARAWNVAAAEIERRGLDATNEEDMTTVLSDLLAPFDSASLCLSKGIGAPIGSAIVGTKEFIDRARWFRKAFGGGVRQSGGLAAAADYALTHHFPRLAGTHALARQLAAGLKDAGCDIIAPVDTNMVFFDPTPTGLTMDAVVKQLASLPEPVTIFPNRCVVHHQTSPQAVEDFIATVAQMVSELPESEREAAKSKKGGARSLGY